MDEIIHLNICGTEFKPTKKTITSIDGSKLSKLDTTKTVHYFDREPSLFKHILSAHRNGIVHIPRDVCPVTFRDEMLFWGIPLQMVAPCCWKYLYEPESEISTFKILVENDNKFNSSYKVDTVRPNLTKTVFKDKISSEDKQYINEPTVAYKCWLFMEEPGSSLAAKLWCFLYIAVVIVSVITYMIWLEPSLRVSRYLSQDPSGIDIMRNETLYEIMVSIFNERLVLIAGSDPNIGLFTIDMFCIIFFTLETIVHFLLCPYKRKYPLQPYNILKVLLCVMMSISLVFEIRKDVMLEDVDAYGNLYFVCKSFNVLRLLLIFRLYKLYNGLHVMLLSLRHSLRELLLLMFTFVVGVVVYGCLIFSAEVETDKFPSTQISMWWSLITMTTVGYGDYYPTTTFGYIVGSVCAINGLIVIALPIAAIAGTFSDLYSRNKDFRTHKENITNEMTDTHLDKCNNDSKRMSISTITNATIFTSYETDTKC